jgi:ADP-heptose:LPS heptosyltransferase
MTSHGEILIVHCGGLKEFVGALPAMKALRDAHRGVGVTLIARGPMARLGADTPYVDEVFEVETLEDSKEIGRAAQFIKAEKFACTFDLERSEASEKLFAALKPFPPPWCGGGRGMKYRYDSLPDEPMNETLSRQLAMAGIDLDPIEPPDARWASTARSNAPSLKPEYFGLKRPYVLLAPASPAPNTPPRWPTARFAGLAERLAVNGVGVGIITDPEDRAPARAVYQAAPDARDLAARADLTQIAALAAQAGGALGHVDSGVVHLMAAAGAPTIAIAPSHEDGQRLGPVGGAVITLNAPVPARTTVDYAAQLIAMYCKVGSLERRPVSELAEAEEDEPGEGENGGM